MPSMPLRQEQVIDSIKDAGKRQFVLFLGAGASYSSGVPVASQMVEEWCQKKFEQANPSGGDKDAWLKLPEQIKWYGADDEYSLLIESLYVTPAARQKYFESKIEGAFPSWGYLYLSDIIQQGYFNFVFTTNFDDLLRDALMLYLGYRPVVCSAESEVDSINMNDERAKIIKLHGDFLFSRLKNTVKELEQLDPNMQRKFGEVVQACGMIVLGYGGHDHSVMTVLQALLQDHEGHYFPNGIFWGVRPGNQAPQLVAELVEHHPEQVYLFECADFDAFMVRLHDKLDLALPETILNPYLALDQKFQRLVAKTTVREATIEKDRAALEERLNWIIAKEADEDRLRLFQAQLNLYRRNYQAAIADAQPVADKRHDADALTTWGNALMIQAEEEGADAALEAAVDKWKAAIALDPNALPARYNLVRYFYLKQRFKEAIVAAEALHALVPNDKLLALNLASLYLAVDRTEDAEKQVDVLLTRDPDDPQLHYAKAQVSQQRGMLPDAVNELKRAVALNSQNPWFHFTLANSLAGLTQLRDAEFEFREAVHLDPKNVIFLLQLATFYWNMQQPLLAQPYLEDAVKLDPKSAEAHGWLGQVYMVMGRLGDAERELREAIRWNPNDARLHSTAGALLLQLNQPQAAEEEFKYATRLNPMQPQPYVGLCVLYRMQNRLQEMSVALQSLKQVAPPLGQQLEMQLMNWQWNAQAALAALQAQWFAAQGGARPQQQNQSWLPNWPPHQR
jgi:tetratricopeptide (TPR) repeat protein